MITQEQFIDGLYRYIRREIIPHMPNYAKLIAGAMLLRNVGRIGDMLKSVADGSILHTLGVLEPDGMIDADLWCTHLKNSMNEFCGGKADIDIPTLPTITFYEADVDALRRYLKGELM